MTDETKTMRIPISLEDRYEKIEFENFPKVKFSTYVKYVIEKEIQKLENQSTSKRPKK